MIGMRELVEDNIRRGLQPVKDSRELRLAADQATTDGWKAQWAVIEGWEHDGKPFLDNGQGKQRWRIRQRRRQQEGRPEMRSAERSAVEIEGEQAAGRHVVDRPTGSHLGTSMAEQSDHQSDSTPISRVVHGSTSAVSSETCQLGNSSTSRAASRGTEMPPQLDSREDSTFEDESPGGLCDRHAANYESRDKEDDMELVAPDTVVDSKVQPGDGTFSRPSGWIWAEDGKHSHQIGGGALAPADVATGTPLSHTPEGADEMPGLKHAVALNSGARVSGPSKKVLRKENKQRRIQKQVKQPRQSYWTEHCGQFSLPMPEKAPMTWRGDMCPSGLALHHPAAGALLQYATRGCPVMPGRDWTFEEIEEAVLRGPHVSAMEPDAIEQLAEELQHKVEIGQARIVEWEKIKHNLPRHMKVSPLAMIPHKSRKYRAILDLSFRLRLNNGGLLESVNDGTVLSAPAGAIDQLGHTLSRVIHAFAEADENSLVLSAKWDIKDGFWRLQCEEGEEWNFCYVLPQKEGEPIKLVVPVSLQMGWVESPPYFCAASETARDVAAQYAETTIGSLRDNKFVGYAMQDAAEFGLPERSSDPFYYFIDVYVDDFISLVVPTSQEQLRHVANSVMTGVHDVFPPNEDAEEDPLSLKKLKKREGTWHPIKDILGFEFNGSIGRKDMILEGPKRELLLTVLTKWIRSGELGTSGVPFAEYKSVLQKLRHAFIALPTGRGLLSPLNKLARMEPNFVFFHKNSTLLQATKDIRTILRESTKVPTKCRQLVNGWPWYVGIVDASSHGVGGVIVGEERECTPTVFRMEWPQFIKKLLIKRGKHGTISNSDLEAAGLLILWLVMEEICDIEPGAHVALFNDNSPTVHWAERLTAKSGPAGFIMRALALRLKTRELQEMKTLFLTSHRVVLETRWSGIVLMTLLCVTK